MKNSLVFFALLLLTACSTTYLALPLKPYEGQSLKTDGVYYNLKVDGDFRAIFLYALHNNGCFVQIPTYLTGNLDSALLQLDTIEQFNIPKYLWGRYIIQDDEIIINNFLDFAPVTLVNAFHRGKILSDTSFVITSVEYEVAGEENFYRTEQVYYFVDREKPIVDSANAYVLGLK